jgi:hypothetical protein
MRQTTLRLTVAAALSVSLLTRAQGERRFWIGWYTNNDVKTLTDGGMSGHGENVVLPQGFGAEPWDPEHKREEAFYTQCAKQSLMVMPTFPRDRILAKNGHVEFITNMVNHGKSRTTLFGWHLFDEPEFQTERLPVPELEEIYRTVKALDPDHPVLMSFGVDNGVEIDHVEAYKDAMDGFLYDRYPVGQGFPENWGAMWQVAVATKNACAVAKKHGLSPVFCCIQGHRWQDQNRLPTYSETRYLVYAAIIQGADGALFWTLGGRADITPKEHIETVVAPIVAEVSSLSAAIYSPTDALVLSSNADTDRRRQGVNDITYLVGELDSAYIIFSACNIYGIDVKFTLRGRAAEHGISSQIEVINEQRTIQLAGQGPIRTFEDRFGTYSNHIYRILKEPRQ